MIRRGLSSIGVILVEITEVRCDATVRLSMDERERYDEAMIVPLPEDASELRLLFDGFVSGLSAKTSKSNFSHSVLEGGMSSMKPSCGGVE